MEIYGLRCPETGHIRYVGKANDSQKRLKTHISDSKRRDTPLYQWLRLILANGKKPSVEVIAKVDASQWKEAEIEVIKKLRLRSHNLLNVANGGNEPYCSKETRVANGRANAKAIHSDPERRRMWELKHQLASTLRTLTKSGRHKKVAEIRARLLTHGITV